MRIFLTKRATSSYSSIREYISNRFGETVARAFEQKVVDFLDLLENFPEIGSMEVPEKQIQGFQITKQTRVFYRIKGERIIILVFFDVRQDPKRKPK